MIANAPPTNPDAAALTALVRLSRALFTGERGGDVSWATLKDGMREAAMRDPLESTLAMVLGGSYLFYLAEKDANPKVQSFWDALVFISTCLSVGYADVFARTPTGKAIASVVMTFGPALSGAIFEPPVARTADGPISDPAVLERLDSILEALRGLRPQPQG